MTRVRIVLASIVTALWVIGYVLAYTGHGETPDQLSGLMVIVLGWAFAGEVKDAIKRKAREIGREDEDAPQD